MNTCSDSYESSDRLTKSVLYSDGLLHICWVRFSSSVDSHDSEAVQRTILQVDHLKLGLLAGVWSLVYLVIVEGEEFTLILFQISM